MYELPPLTHKCLLFVLLMNRKRYLHEICSKVFVNSVCMFVWLVFERFNDYRGVIFPLNDSFFTNDYTYWLKVSHNHATFYMESTWLFNQNEVKVKVQGQVWNCEPVVVASYTLDKNDRQACTVYLGISNQILKNMCSGKLWTCLHTLLYMYV